MNVTLKIDDALCKQARHRAVDENRSLSGWVADLIQREIQQENSKHRTPIEAIGMDDELDLMDYIPSRKDEIERPLEFP